MSTYNLFKEFHPLYSAKNGSLTKDVYELFLGPPNSSIAGLFDYLFVVPWLIKQLCSKTRHTESNIVSIVSGLLMAIHYFIFYCCLYALIIIPLSILLLPSCWLANRYLLNKWEKLETELGLMEVLPIEQLMGAKLTLSEDIIDGFSLSPSMLRDYNKRLTIPQETLYRTFYAPISNVKPSFVTFLDCIGREPQRAECIYLTDANHVETGDIVFGLYKSHDDYDLPTFPACFIIPCLENAQIFRNMRSMAQTLPLDFLCHDIKLDRHLTKKNPFITMAQNRAKQQMFAALGIHHYTPKGELRNSVLDLMPEIMNFAGFGNLELEKPQLSSFVSQWSPRLFEAETPKPDGVFQSELSQTAAFLD